MKTNAKIADAIPWIDLSAPLSFPPSMMSESSGFANSPFDILVDVALVLAIERAILDSHSHSLPMHDGPSP